MQNNNKKHPPVIWLLPPPTYYNMCVCGCTIIIIVNQLDEYAQFIIAKFRIVIIFQTNLK